MHLGAATPMHFLSAVDNRGEITRIYTSRMAGELEEDLRTLKQEYHI